MTYTQIIKALDEQINASFKRSASDPVEAQLRTDIRATQALFAKAQKMKIYNRSVRNACVGLLKTVTPEMGAQLRPMLAPYLNGTI